MPERTSLKCPTEPRYHDDLIGCGSNRLTGPDGEGLYDCCDCGLFFTAEAASTQKEQGDTNAT